jgi:polyisoprenyl-phosphate glycosyltransferase
MISVVLPAFNEQDAVADTVHAVARVLENASLKPFEVLVVDDGSTDLTSERARQAGARVVRHPHNAGYGQSLKSGIAAASYDTIVIADADGTYPPDEIPLLVAEYTRGGFDMVVGARQGKHYRESPLKQPLRLILKFLVEFTTGRSIPDINSGLRVFSGAMSQKYFAHLCDTFSFTTSLTLAYMMTGRFVAYHPIGYSERTGRTKVRLLRDALRTLQYIVQAIIYYNPLKIFILLSAFCLLFAVFCLAMALLFHLTSGFFLGLGSILLAILVFCLGLLADLLRQIMVK